MFFCSSVFFLAFLVSDRKKIPNIFLRHTRTVCLKSDNDTNWAKNTTRPPLHILLFSPPLSQHNKKIQSSPTKVFESGNNLRCDNMLNVLICIECNFFCIYSLVLIFCPCFYFTNNVFNSPSSNIVFSRPAT